MLNLSEDVSKAYLSSSMPSSSLLVSHSCGRCLSVRDRERVSEIGARQIVNVIFNEG